jgi:hypothetical protein
MLSLQQIETRINDVFVMAKICKLTNVQLNASIAESMQVIYSRTPAGRLRYSMWEQGYSRGLIAAHNSAIWFDVEFCYRDKNGTIFSTAKNSMHRSIEEFYGNGTLSLINDMECAHLWIGSYKEYTTWHKITRKEGMI